MRNAILRNHLNCTWEMAEEFAHCSESIIRLFFVACLSNYGLATLHSEVTNRHNKFTSPCWKPFEYFLFTKQNLTVEESQGKIVCVEGKIYLIVNCDLLKGITCRLIWNNKYEWALYWHPFDASKGNVLLSITLSCTFKILEDVEWVKFPFFTQKGTNKQTNNNNKNKTKKGACNIKKNIFYWLAL